MRKPLNDPMYQSPRTYRDYEMYRYGVAYSRGWNDAMDFIFGRREESAKLTLLKPTEIRYDNHTEDEETDG